MKLLNVQREKSHQSSPIFRTSLWFSMSYRISDDRKKYQHIEYERRNALLVGCHSNWWQSLSTIWRISIKCFEMMKLYRMNRWILKKFFFGFPWPEQNRTENVNVDIPNDNESSRSNNGIRKSAFSPNNNNHHHHHPMILQKMEKSVRFFFSEFKFRMKLRNM